MDRTIFTEDHHAFRSAYRAFCEKEIAPYEAGWEKTGVVDRSAWLEAGKQGFLGFMMPEELGGSGTDDFRFNAIMGEEQVRVGASGPGFTLHNDVVAPYLLKLCTDEQRQRWFPAFCSGEMITAIAMSEPGAGSDLQGIRTTAVDAGDHWVLNGSKIFITNGINADLVIVVAKTSPEKGAHGISLIAVERGMEGFTRGKNLDKVGMKAQDTAELFFTDVTVPKTNLLGTLDGGFVHLMEALPQERLSIAVVAVAACETALEMTLQYCKDRTAFGKPIGSFQANRFTLAELHTETAVARIFVDRCIEAHLQGTLTIPDAAQAKYFCTELQNRVMDRCVQLHGGYGYMNEYPIAKAWRDSRVQTIYGGTTEVMKEIIGRSLGV